MERCSSHVNSKGAPLEPIDSLIIFILPNNVYDCYTLEDMKELIYVSLSNHEERFYFSDGSFVEPVFLRKNILFYKFNTFNIQPISGSDRYSFFATSRLNVFPLSDSPSIYGTPIIKTEQQKEYYETNMTYINRKTKLIKGLIRTETIKIDDRIQRIRELLERKYQNERPMLFESSREQFRLRYNIIRQALPEVRQRLIDYFVNFISDNQKGIDSGVVRKISFEIIREMINGNYAGVRKHLQNNEVQNAVATVLAPLARAGIFRTFSEQQPSHSPPRLSAQARPFIPSSSSRSHSPPSRLSAQAPAFVPSSSRSRSPPRLSTQARPFVPSSSRSPPSRLSAQARPFIPPSSSRSPPSRLSAQAPAFVPSSAPRTSPYSTYQLNARASSP